MKIAIRCALYVCVLCLPTWAVQAQQVYRCGQTYSERPCTGAVAIDTNDARSAKQKRESQKATQRDKQLAKELEDQRKKEDALAQAGSTPAEEKPKPSKPAKTKKKTPAKKKGPEFFTAATPPPPKASKEKSTPAR